MTELPPELDEEPPEDPYRSLGGLARPDAYYGAKEFHCGTCGAEPQQKCTVWVERLGRDMPRRMPCLSRLAKAKAAGLL